MRIPSFPLIAACLGLLGAAPPKPALAPADTTGAGADTLRKFQVDEPIVTEADLMTLREVIERCVEGERTKLLGIQDMTFTTRVRSIVTWKHKRVVWDGVYLVYQNDEKLRKTVELVEEEKHFKKDGDSWVADEEEGKKESSFSVSAGEDEGEDLSNLPFFLEDQKDYDFELLERILEEDHVVFKIRFRPKSRFKPLPSGTVYVDTNRFRIVHEEFTFDGENPFPLLIKDIRRVSRHWKELPTGEWVAWKILGEVELKGSWTRIIPEKAEFAVLLDNYRFNQGYDERLFGPKGEK